MFHKNVKVRVCIAVCSVCMNPKEVNLFCFENFIIYLNLKKTTLVFLLCFCMVAFFVFCSTQHCNLVFRQSCAQCTCLCNASG